MTDTKKLKVFYDGACPICTKEIGYYQDRRGADEIDWIDLTLLEDGEVHPGLQRDAALARFHVATPDGRIMNGGPAFARLWSSLPAFGLLGRVFEIRLLSRVLDRIYDLLLIVRPRLQKWFR